jgi:hypothetical protein
MTKIICAVALCFLPSFALAHGDTPNHGTGSVVIVPLRDAPYRDVVSDDDVQDDTPNVTDESGNPPASPSDLND